MKTKIKLLINGLAVAMTLLPGLGEAQTVISGPNITTSTWSPSGNPYVIASDCNVPSGQTLTIQPGTVVWIGSGVSLTGNGMISAMGTSAQRITFQAPISSQTWNTIIVNNTTGTNQFKYCDFLNATNALDFRGASLNQVSYCTFSNAATALTYRDNSANTTLFCNFQNVSNGIWMTVLGNNWNQTNRILNCTFSNCMSQAVSGEAVGQSIWYGNFPYARIVASVKCCSFYGVSAGCRFNSSGIGGWFDGCGYGYGNIQMINNIFCNVTNTAIWLIVGSQAGGGPVNLINNTVMNAGSGVVVQDPWDAKVQSCLFVGCTNGVTRSGSLSATVSYNGFYGNATNFTGYPGTYGMVILANRNSTPSDVLYNIFQDPKFVSTSDFHLQAGSPAIDAGSPDWAYTDMCFSNSVSQGSSYPDLGAYGGPDAVNWLSGVPVLPVQATMTYSNKITSLNWGAIPRSEYLIQYLTNFATVGTNKWLNFTNGDVLATDKPTSLIVATNQSQPQMFFRIQSLGRPAGN